MASVLSRIFKIGQAETHAIVDKLEDPVKMTEQGIRDLKTNLGQAVSSLAEVKALCMRLKNQADTEQAAARDYEAKAIKLLEKVKAGEMEQAEAESLATELLSRKEESERRAAQALKDYESQNALATNLSAKVNDMKTAVGKYENELITLKARSRTAESMTKINKTLSNVDTSGTVNMLERMKTRVAEKESVAAAYGEIIAEDPTRSLDDRVNKALSTGGTAPGSASLDELKKQLNM